MSRSAGSLPTSDNDRTPSHERLGCSFAIPDQREGRPGAIRDQVQERHWDICCIARGEQVQVSFLYEVDKPIKGVDDDMKVERGIVSF